MSQGHEDMGRGSTSSLLEVGVCKRDQLGTWPVSLSSSHAEVSQAWEYKTLVMHFMHLLKVELGLISMETSFENRASKHGFEPILAAD